MALAPYCCEVGLLEPPISAQSAVAISEEAKAVGGKRRIRGKVLLHLGAKLSLLPCLRHEKRR
eukprot:1150099-Pelagomonas_calceolata.AAC.3